MKRIALTGLALAAILAAGVGGYRAGVRGLPAPGLRELFDAAGVPAAAEPADTEAVIYYRDPDGKPAYSATPRQTGDGRAFSRGPRQRGCELRGQAASDGRGSRAGGRRAARHLLP